MDDSVPQLVHLLVVLLLVLLNGCFVAGEFSIISSSPAKLKDPEEREKRGSRAGIWLIGKLDLSLSATQLGITTSSLLLGWYGVVTFSQSFTRTFLYFGIPLRGVWALAIGVIFALILVAMLHLVLGELVAKSLAIRYPERTLRILSGPLVVFTQLCRPIIYLGNHTVNFVLKFFGTSIPSKFERFHSASEISQLVSQSTEGGVFDEDEEKMLRGVFGFSDTVAREVMTPRTDLVTIDLNANFEELMSTVAETGLSRFPVKKGEIDDIVGVILVKDLLGYIPENLKSGEQSFSIRKAMREPYFIPGTKPIDDLLNEFKKRKIHMAIVLDEHGGVDGVVTLEDLIEEIVGDIFDESDELEHAIVEQENGDILVDGGTLVSDLNEQFSLHIPEGEYDTIAGFIFTSLGRMTKVGDQVLVSKRGAVLIVDSNNSGGKQNLFRVGENGARQEVDEREFAKESVDSLKALITVTKVKSHRIEFVRLRLLTHGEELEPHTAQPASQIAG